MSKDPKKLEVYRLVSDDKRVLAKGTRLSLKEIQDILGGTITHRKNINGLNDEYNNR